MTSAENRAESLGSAPARPRECDAIADDLSTRRVTVVIPSFNHAAFVEEAIMSVAGQDHPATALHVVDDGSRDESVRVIERTLNRLGLRDCRFEVQPNQGVSKTLNRLIEDSESEYLSILHSDDSYSPNRLSRMLRALASSSDKALGFGFSQGAFLSAGNPAEKAAFVDTQMELLRRLRHLPTAGFALLARNVPVSSSNFVFSRALFERVGGFHPEMVIGEEWDFALQCSLHVEPVCVPDSLWQYRLHPGNTWRSQQGSRARSLELMFGRFTQSSAGSVENPLAPLPWHWPRFFRLYARAVTTSFGDQPLASLLPPSWLAATPQRPPGSAHGPAPRELEAAAMDDLLRMVNGIPGGPETDMDGLYAGCAGHWQEIKSAHR